LADIFEHRLKYTIDCQFVDISRIEATGKEKRSSLIWQALSDTKLHAFGLPVPKLQTCFLICTGGYLSGAGRE
jgi:hypothetical protein